MSNRTSAARYARALLDVALKESDPEKAERDLTAFVSAMDASAEFKRVLLSPRVPAATRRQAAEIIAQKMGVESPVAKLLALLAERGRLEIYHELLEVYRERLLAHKNIVTGTVTTAAPLATEKVQALERSLSEATGKQVQLEVAVDPAIIGGVVTRIGSTVYDGSIRTQLQRMKQQLIEGA
jgi:F-type H+-transporting ATPase subunit delta